MKNAQQIEARRRRMLEELYARIEDMTLAELMEMLSVARHM